MHTKLSILSISALITLTGCATSTANYTPPMAAKIQNSKQVNQQFDAVWDRLVKQLSSDFFVINNIDKNSRLINISFSSKRPSDFVDCGQSSRSFENARGKQNYTYKTSDSAQFVTTNKSGIAANITRNSKLEGRTNIYIAPEGAGTMVNVNTKYIVSVNVIGRLLDGRPIGNENHTFDFSTKEGYSENGISCHATGAIEKRILTLVGE